MVEMADVVGAELSFARNEHYELRAGVDAIHDTANELGWTSNQQTAAAIGRVRNWVQTVLVPHAAWEDAVVYPEIERRTQTEWSVKQARYEHYQIERAAGQLTADIDVLHGPVTHEQACEIRSHLIALETLLRSHMEREELFLLPVIDEDWAERPAQ